LWLYLGNLFLSGYHCSRAEVISWRPQF